MRVSRPYRRGLAATTLTLAVLGLSAGPAAGNQGSAELFPNPARPGDAIAVNTTHCTGDSSATGDATTVGGGTFQLTPATHPEVLTGQFTVPPNTRAGDYGISVTCASGGRVATADLRVVQADSTASPTATQPTATATAPSGGVQGGVGGPGQNHTAVIAGSSAVLIAVAAGGVWVLRRRHAGGDH